MLQAGWPNLQRGRWSPAHAHCRTSTLTWGRSCGGRAPPALQPPPRGCAPSPPAATRGSQRPASCAESGPAVVRWTVLDGTTVCRWSDGGRCRFSLTDSLRKFLKSGHFWQHQPTRVHVGCGSGLAQATCTLAALLTFELLDKTGCGVDGCSNAVPDCWQPCRPVAPSSALPAPPSAAGPPPQPWLLRGCRCAQKSGHRGLQAVRKALSARRVTQHACLMHATVPEVLKHHGLQAVQSARLNMRTTALAE